MGMHTPGPWEIGGTLISGQHCIVGDEDTVVALMPDETMGCTYKVEDGRLIAAAPELLDSLIVAREWLRGDKWRNSTVEKHASWEALMRGIDKAIAKATGGAK